MRGPADLQRSAARPARLSLTARGLEKVARRNLSRRCAARSVTAAIAVVVAKDRPTVSISLRAEQTVEHEDYPERDGSPCEGILWHSALPDTRLCLRRYLWCPVSPYKAQRSERAERDARPLWLDGQCMRMPR